MSSLLNAVRSILLYNIGRGTPLIVSDSGKKFVKHWSTALEHLSEGVFIRIESDGVNQLVRPNTVTRELYILELPFPADDGLVAHTLEYTR